MSEIASGAVQGIWDVVRPVVYDRIKSYISYIKNYDQNLNSLCENLEMLCVEKKDVDVKVLSGKERLEKLTFKAAHWLARVQDLSKDEEMTKLMTKDIRIAKAMLRLMKNADLKKLVEKDGKMYDLVVEVMNDIKKRNRSADDGETSDAEEKDKEVGLVLEKLMEETMGEFKALLQSDIHMAVAALHLLENHMEILGRLTEKDKKVADIIAKARMMSHEEELSSPDSNDDILMCENTLRKTVANLLKPVEGIILDEELLKALPENVALGMKAMGIVAGNRKALKAELVDAGNTSKHRNCCYCVFSYNYFSDRHDMSKAAAAMLHKIKFIIRDKPGNQDLTRPLRRAEMVGIPTNFVGLESRKECLLEIIKALASNDVQAVGIFGMGGSGKTTLAKEIVNSKANGIFHTTIMVEISESPNIEYIQDQIANGLGLADWDNVHGISEKATWIYNRLKRGVKSKEKKEKDDDNNLSNRLRPEDKSEWRKDDVNNSILLVLDNIWKEIDLPRMGIPREYCKLLLTSREKDVCKAMNVLEANIYEVGLLNDNESKDLFQVQVQKKVHIGEYKSAADRLLKKCGGLPLCIVATANSLKGKELPFWRQFAEELEKPISCQITGARYETFSILKTSYEAMASEEKKIFFLLACLSPIGSSISIDNLMRYGIGLGLFQHVNKLSEAIELAHTWAEELVSSSMLLKGDSDECVKIHDVVRESTMSFASKSGINTDGQMFLVDAIPRWIFEETFNKYTGISLLAQANFARLSGAKADLLQILLFKGNENHSSFLESNFFQGMANLKVLEILFMNFEQGLPESLSKLKVLKTLHLVNCKLGDIKLIGELGSLLVLSLRGSSLDGLPDEIGKLYNLRLLDMSKCQCEEPRISGNVIARLSLLEGLYLADSNLTQWAVTESTSNDTAVTNGADMDGFNKLEFLNVLEIQMLDPISLPIGAQFVQNLDKFQIIVGQEGSEAEIFTRDTDFEVQPSQRALVVSKFDVSQELKKDNCLKELLKKADFLALNSAAVDNIVPELDKEGYRDLNRLKMSNIDGVSRICEGKAPTELFCNLCHLEVSKLDNLEELLPVSPLPRKMTTLQISDCNSLTYIFSELDMGNKESDIIELSCLKILALDGVSNLIGVVKESNNDDSRRSSFCNRKVTLISLELLSLRNNKRIVKLWDPESNLHSFQNLKILEISSCEEMESVGPPSMFLSLVQLEGLTIENCKKMQEVISGGSETQEIPKESIMFPNLRWLEIEDIDNLECFYGGSYKMAFPRLENLTLYSLKRMTKFAGGINSTAFFPRTIEFPCLETLGLGELNDKVKVLWDLHELADVEEGEGISSNPIPNLREVDIGKIKLPSIVFQSLSILNIEPVGDAKFLFSSSENEGCAGTYSQFPKLEELTIEGCSNSAQQIVEDDGSTAMMNFCGQLRSLVLQCTSNIEMTSLHPFKSLRELSISGLKLEYCFSVDCGFEQFQSLEELSINDCQNLKVIIQGGDKDKAVDFPLRFPSLEYLYIDSCNKLESLFCGEPNQVVELLALEDILIWNCNAMKSFSTRPLKAPKLRKLMVFHCPKMEWFLPGNSNCNADLELPSLEKVTIEKCPNMKSLSPAILRAPLLRKLYVAECNKWEWLFDGEANQVVELPSLEKVTIEECDAMKSFSTRPLKAPKLRQLAVFNCSAMECFLSGNSSCNAALELPSLEHVTIAKCPNIKSFSPAVLRAPKLQLVKVDDKPYPVAEIEDLNHVLHSANSGEQTAAHKNDL